jgi:hypothetical protein
MMAMRPCTNIVAMIYIVATIIHTSMPQDQSPRNRERKARDIVLRSLRKQGPAVISESPPSARADLNVRVGSRKYLIEIKVGPEGRADRLLPLWSQAFVQVCNEARRRNAIPFAVVASERVSERVAQQILDFAREHAPEAAVGVIDLHGLRRFRGPGLDSMDADPVQKAGPPKHPPVADLFSDLNQWMLKVLFAPDLPAHLLRAPRQRYSGPNELAKAAGVSPMSAFRLVRQLDRDGYLDREAGHLKLVQRADLLQRWSKAAASRPVRELPARFLLRGDIARDAARLCKQAGACAGLFFAADQLGLGFVSGVPPCIYVRNLDPGLVAAWKNVDLAQSEESADFHVRRAPASESVFRGAVDRDGVLVSDVIQVWLDVASHPSRGAEQAALIHKRIIQPMLRP